MADTLLPSYETSVNIELEDLQELARINPTAWEQLLHLVDNRQNKERIEGLEAQLRSLGESSKELVDLQKDKIKRADVHIDELESHLDSAHKKIVDVEVAKKLQHYPFYDEEHTSVT